MRDTSFLLYTAEGEKLAQSLVASVCSEIEADRLTRKAALDHLADALERVSDIDHGVNEPEAAEAIARRVTASFRKVGYTAVDGRSLVAHYENWMRVGAPVAPLPRRAELNDAVEAARQFAAAAAPLFLRTDITASVSDVEPWNEGFKASAAADADLTLFSWRGDLAGAPHLSGMVMGGTGSMYLEDFPRAADPAGVLKDNLLKRPGVDYDSLAAQIGDLARSSANFSRVTARMQEPARLDIGISMDGDVFSASVRWDEVDMLLRDFGAVDGGIPLDEAVWQDEAPDAEAETVRPGM